MNDERLQGVSQRNWLTPAKAKALRDRLREVEASFQPLGGLPSEAEVDDWFANGGPEYGDLQRVVVAVAKALSPPEDR